MVPRRTTILQRVTAEWPTRLPPEAMLTVGHASGSTAWRDRVLTPVTPRPLLLWPVLPGHTACRHRPPRSGVRFTAAASWPARAPRPLPCVALRLERFGTAGPAAAVADGRWPGHRPWFVDGSGGSRPEPPPRQDAGGPSTGPRPGGGCPMAHLLGRCPAGTGVLLKRVVAPRLPHALAQGQRGPPRCAPGRGRGAARGRWAYAPLARLVQAGGPAGRRVGARPSGDVTPGRPVVLPPVRRTAAVPGRPRSRWRTALGVHAPRAAWLPPTTAPSWLPRDAWAARPASLGRRAVR
jgi:hypothetical protein